MVSKQPKVFWAVDCWDSGTCQSFPEMPASIRKDFEYILTDTLIDPVFPGRLESLSPTWRHFQCPQKMCFRAMAVVPSLSPVSH